MAGLVPGDGFHRNIREGALQDIEVVLYLLAVEAVALLSALQNQREGVPLLSESGDGAGAVGVGGHRFTFSAK